MSEPAPAPAPPSSPPRPQLCVGALVRGPAGTYLIVRTTKWRGAWGVPGGKVEWGETLTDATTRELREEVGLHVEGLQYVQMQEAILSPEFLRPAHMLLIDYLAHAGSEAVTPNEEIEDWAWVTLEQAAAYPLNSFTRTLIEQARQLERS